MCDFYTFCFCCFLLSGSIHLPISDSEKPSLMIAQLQSLSKHLVATTEVLFCGLSVHQTPGGILGTAHWFVLIILNCTLLLMFFFFLHFFIKYRLNFMCRKRTFLNARKKTLMFKVELYGINMITVH